MSPKQRRSTLQRKTGDEEHFALPVIAGPMSPGRIVPVQNPALIENERIEKFKSSLTVGNSPVKAREDLTDQNLTNLKMARHQT